MREKYDFSGWATKNDLKCSDGRTIRKDAFKDNDGQTVPLVWNHDHHDPMNVLGHALLENRDQGVYAYCTFNDTAAGNNARQLVRHGDVTALSIYANKLKQYGGDVVHGAIREVSLVLAGANPGAFIDAVLEHGELAEDAGIIYTGEEIELAHTVTDQGEAVKAVEPKEEVKEEPPAPTKSKAKKKAETLPEPTADAELEHADSEEKDMEDETVQDVFNTLSDKQKQAVYALIGMALDEKEGSAQHSDDEDGLYHADDDSDETVQDVFDSLTDKQKTVVYALIGQALENAGNSKDDEDEGDSTVKHNIFDTDEMTENQDVLSHSEFEEILNDAKRGGSLKDAFLAHGIEDIDYLFPDAKNINDVPEFIKDPDDWVSVVMGGVRKTPFSRIKTLFADITEADARAKGYIKGHRKIEEVFGLLKRTTTPQTVYKTQKLDRDDVLDITDFDVIAWLKGEMRMKLDEELARAFLIGDGRNIASEDKIQEDHIRPIWTDDDLFTIKKTVSIASIASDDEKAKAFIRAAVKARKNYRGSGNPTLFTTEDVLTDCLLMEDNMGRVIYDTVQKLETALRVSKIVTVPPMEGVTREADGKTYALMGLIVNLKDYNVGADKGGQVSMFDDFDIDYNKMKYLIETRCSGALIKPFSAIALELTYSAILGVEPEDPSSVLLGKAVSSLQEDVVVHDKFIKGTLKYVTGYTGFSGDADEQSGNYLALHFDVSDGATTTVQLLGGSHKDPVTLDNDNNCVFRITDRNTQRIKVVTTLGDDTITKIYSLAGLSIETA
ncbi:MAG: phage major capsid protein [Pseudobutyrivibrio sp.]|nr:phage major capsid protein [Pseudobutyrivibrio sp.]